MIKLSVKNSSLNSSAPTSTAPPQPQTSQIPPKILSQPKRKSKIDGDETAPIEEHLILRLSPNSPMLSALKEQFKQNQTPDLKIKFKSDRACTITSGQFHHTATLVDLPCIIESSKTLDSKLFHKTGDICQMILVDEKNDLKDYVYPHGITPPMKFVRKRRFRKRISKRAIEDVEREIERLLKADLEAHDVKYEVHEQTEPEEVEEVVEEFDEEFIDEPADVEEATAEIVDADSTSEEEDSDENEEEEIIEQEDPLKLQMALVLDEVNDLEAKIHEKEEQVSTYANPIMKKRLEDIIRDLQEELEAKRSQLELLEANATQDIETIDDMQLDQGLQGSLQVEAIDLVEKEASDFDMDDAIDNLDMEVLDTADLIGDFDDEDLE